MLITLKFVGVDSWNRPVFKDINTKYYYGSTNKLFSYEAEKAKVVKYFKQHPEELEYFGSHFDCEPMGGLNEGVKFEFID